MLLFIPFLASFNESVSHNVYVVGRVSTSHKVDCVVSSGDQHSEGLNKDRTHGEYGHDLAVAGLEPEELAGAEDAATDVAGKVEVICISVCDGQGWKAWVIPIVTVWHLQNEEHLDDESEAVEEGQLKRDSPGLVHYSWVVTMNSKDSDHVDNYEVHHS